MMSMHKTLAFDRKLRFIFMAPLLFLFSISIALPSISIAAPSASEKTGTPILPPAPVIGTPSKTRKIPGPQILHKEGLRFLRDAGASAAFTADEMREDRARKRVVGKGFADIRFLGNRIQADYVEIQTETRDGVATGNIVFQQGNDRLVGSRIEFNLDSEKVTIYDARGYLGATYYIKAEVIRRVSEDRYEIIRGTFTTCEGDRPDWLFASRKTNFQIEGYAQLSTPVFEISGVPVAAFPWMVVPVKSKRATGLLIPIIGFGSRNGYQHQQEFFWAINRWSDATFGVGYLSNRGVKTTGEYRYILSNSTSGNIFASYLKDKLENTTFMDIRGAHHSALLGGSVDAKIDISRRDKLDRSLEGDLAERTRQNTDSSIFYTRSFSSLSGILQAGARRQEGLVDKDGQIFQKFPEISLDINQKQLGTSNFYYNQKSSFISFHRLENERTTDLTRIHFAPQFQVPIQTVPWLGVTPRVGFFETYWTAQKRNPAVPNNPDREDIAESGLSRELWEAGIDVSGPRFSRVYPAEIGPFQGFKHIVSLSSGYTYIPAMDAQDRRLIIPIDGVDSLGDVNTISYGINNRILTKIRGESGFETRQLVSVDLNQSFDIAEARRTQNPERKKRPFGNVALIVQSRPFSKLRLTHEEQYNVYVGKIMSHTTGFQLNGGRNWFLNIDRTWKRLQPGEFAQGEESSVNLAAGIAITPRWFIEYATRINKVENLTLEQTVILRYKGCCWGFAVTITDTRDESEIFFTIELVGLLEGSRAPAFKSRRQTSSQGRFLGGNSLSPFRFQEPSNQ
ncbi:MAG: LPS assembly protein LptD [bacterium]|nr:LPS assembly protein LptD [bacterium]